MAGDANFDKVALLLHGDGPNGATSFVDSSGVPKTVTGFNSTQISSANSKFGGSSIFFDGANDYISSPLDSDFQLGVVDFTLEFWVYPVARTQPYPTLVANGFYAAPFLGIYLGHQDADPNKYAVAVSNVTFPALTSATNIAFGSWAHLALTRSGTTFRLFIDGNLESVFTSSVSLDGNGDSFFIGGTLQGGQPSNCYIDEFRLTKGFARYTANFTPPTEAFPNSVSANYLLSGAVTGSTGTPVARLVRAQREDTGAYVGGVISNATTGAYTISTEHPGEHTVVAYPVTGENLPALVHHGVIPI